MPVCRPPSQEERAQLMARYMEFYYDWTEARASDLSPNHLDPDTLYIAVWDDYRMILPDSGRPYHGKVMSVIWPDRYGPPLHDLLVWHQGELVSVEPCPLL